MNTNLQNEIKTEKTQNKFVLDRVKQSFFISLLVVFANLGNVNFVEAKELPSKTLTHKFGQIENIVSMELNNESVDLGKEIQQKFSQGYKNYQQETMELIIKLIPVAILNIIVLSIFIRRATYNDSGKIDSALEVYMRKVDEIMDRWEQISLNLFQRITKIEIFNSKIEINKIFSCQISFADEDEMYQKVNKIVYNSKIEELEKYLINIQNTIKKLQQKVDSKDDINNKSELESFILVLNNILIIVETQIICSN